MQKQKTRINRFAFIIPFLLFIITCGIYFHNLSSSVFGGDVGDFISAIVTYGVPHPSGYPLFTMLGILANNLPFGFSVAWKIGIISVLSASFSVVLLYVLVDWIVKNKLIAGISALYMAFFSIFW
ncbi:MAG TPA: DUF2723 domain-containing protein, partial [Patescibacteria group bacterium]